MFFQDAYSLHSRSFSHYFYRGVINFDAHFHTDFEVGYVVSGALDMTVEGRTCTAHPGDFMLVLPNQMHATHSPGDVVLWFADFSADLVNTFARDVEDHSGTGFVFSGAGSVAEQILRNYMGSIPRQSSRSIVAAMLPQNVYEIQALLFAICAEYIKQIELVPSARASNELSNHIAQYVQRHFQENLSLSSVAAALNYDVYYLSRYFNHTFRMNFRQYLNACRVNYAKQLIHETNQTFTTIASECGYQSIRTFNHAFQLQTGLTPSAYRNMTTRFAFTSIDPAVSAPYLES